MAKSIWALGFGHLQVEVLLIRVIHGRGGRSMVL